MNPSAPASPAPRLHPLWSRARALFDAWQHYGNPLEVLLARRDPAPGAQLRVVDRASGIACQCKVAAHRMFGEVWFDHDYDVPGMPLRRGDVVVDVGANQGFFTCYAAWKGCTVFAFEPDPENFALLERNVRENGFADRVRLFPSAVKGTVGSTTLFRTDQLGGGMNTTSTAFAENLGLKPEDGLTVQAVCLPDLLRAEGIARVRLCKLDCEGAELEIIESLSADDAARIESFALEYHPQAYAPRRLVEAVERWGSHHVSAAAPKYCEREMLYATAKDAFRESTALAG